MDLEKPDGMIVNKEQPDWDFRPWFYEKFGSVERGVEAVVMRILLSFFLIKYLQHSI
jgi:hypothetical protein